MIAVSDANDSCSSRNLLVWSSASSTSDERRRAQEQWQRTGRQNWPGTAHRTSLQRWTIHRRQRAEVRRCSLSYKRLVRAATELAALWRRRSAARTASSVASRPDVDSTPSTCQPTQPQFRGPAGRRRTQIRSRGVGHRTPWSGAQTLYCRA